MSEFQNQDQEFIALIEQNLSLVRHIVCQVSVRFPKHVDRGELARAGMLGLVQAARRYNPSKGIPFQGFAARRIRGAILDAVRTVDWAPRSLRRSARSMEDASGKLANELGRKPTPAETADSLGMTLHQLDELQDQVNRAVVLTLNMPVAEADDDEEITLGDTVACGSESAEEALETREMHAYLRDAVELLPKRHRLVIEGYFFAGRTSTELADELGVSTSRISQLRAAAFEILKDGIALQFAEPAKPKVEAERHPKMIQRKAEYAAAIATRRTWKDRLQTPDQAAGPIATAV